MRKIFFLLSFAAPSFCQISLQEHFNQTGYLEIFHEEHHSIAEFDDFYACFDTFIEFLQQNPHWAQKLYAAKERFIRSKERNYYSSDFFGLYDESKRGRRAQISFYYSRHFHTFISSRYPEFFQAPEILQFFTACFEMQKPYGILFEKAASELGLEAIFSLERGAAPILLKVVKYLSSYTAQRPHYDGSTFSLFLDSTDTQSLLLSPYKTSFTRDDFSSPYREFPSRSSILLIPGAFLTEFGLYPTPHIVLGSGKTRYATIAFAMRSHHNPQKIELSPLPNFD